MGVAPNPAFAPAAEHLREWAQRNSILANEELCEWLRAHPDALEIFREFGAQGWENCWAVVELALPPECLAGKCGCTGRDGRGPDPSPASSWAFVTGLTF